VTALDQDQIKSSIEAEVKSFLSEQLRNVQIPPQSGQTDTSMGTYKYEISEMVLSDMKFDNVKVDIQQRKITISVKDLEAHMKNVSWKYAQIKFPYLKDSGTLDASVSQVSCNIDFEIKPMGGGPALTLSNFNINIASVELKTQGGTASWLYNFLFKLFKGQIKIAIQDQLHQVLSSSVTMLTDNINAIGAQLLFQTEDDQVALAF